MTHAQHRKFKSVEKRTLARLQAKEKYADENPQNLKTWARRRAKAAIAKLNRRKNRR